MTGESPFEYIAKIAQKEDGVNFLKISAKYVDDIGFLDHIAKVQADIKDYRNSILTLEKMLTLTNDQSAVLSIYSNASTLYNKVNEPQKALDNLNFISRTVSAPEIEMEKALSHYFLGNYKESESIMRKLSEEKLPEKFDSRIKYNLSLYEIENGDFKTGYRQFVENGHKIQIWPTTHRPMIPLWKGEIVKDKTILIHGEGGIGDEIISIRFMNNIKDLGMRPVWKTNNKHLKEVFNRNGYETIYNYSELEGEDISQVMAMYLPILLDLDETQVCMPAYMSACDNHIKKWKDILPEGKKIALRWQGNTAYEQDLHRSIPSQKMKDLKYSDGNKISLQIDEEVDWAYNPNINTIEDTLAIMSLCEGGVVTSCTSTAHMAAAIGVKTIVCPPIAYYYVWSDKVKWYGDYVSVIKQKHWNNWDFVFEEVQERINAY